MFYYHMKLHYSQTRNLLRQCKPQFYYHMKLHYSQTDINEMTKEIVFYYHMKLHYSQTISRFKLTYYMFYYHMKLHYSQTIVCIFIRSHQFYYHMKLHYSQTFFTPITIKISVLLPYEITLLSNAEISKALGAVVLLPYEITLLSNDLSMALLIIGFYYHMKLHYSQTSNSCGREYLVHYLTGQFHMQYFKL